MHFQVYVATAYTLPQTNIVYKPIESFLPDVQIFIAQGNLNEIRNHFEVEIDHYLQSIEHLPREAFDTLFTFNARTLAASRLPEPLKEACIEFLKELKGQYVVEFNKAIDQQTLAVKNYKIVVGHVDATQTNYRTKFLEQAPIIADSLNDILVDLSRNLKRIVAEFMNEIYTISVDTLVNEATNWRMNEHKKIVWIAPDFTHRHLLPYGTSIPDEFMLPLGPMGPPAQGVSLLGPPPQPAQPIPMNQFGPPNPGNQFGPPPNPGNQFGVPSNPGIPFNPPNPGNPFGPPDQSGPNSVQFSQGTMLPPGVISLPMHP